MDSAPDPFRPLDEDEAFGAATPPRSGAEAWHPQIPAPEEPPDAAVTGHSWHGTAAAVWVYRDDMERPLFATVRFNLTKPDGSPVLDGKGKQKKVVLPLTFGMLRGKQGWHFKAPPSPRPLYGLERLGQQPGAPVLLVEGEKKADAASRLFPGYVAMSWQGGCGAVADADWRSLAGRRVVVWPDADAAGRAAATKLLKAVPEAGAAVPALAAARDLVDRFHRMVRARTPDALPAWITDATSSMLASFGRGIADDQAAVRAALTEPWSNGVTEGHVTKLKLVRRQMYGRGKLDLLRARLVVPA